MKSKSRHGDRKETEAVAGLGEAAIVFAVHDDLVGRVEVVAFVEDAAAPEGGAGGNVAATAVEDKFREAVRAADANGRAVLVDEEGFAVEEVGGGMLGEGGGDKGELAGEIPLVGVEPGDDIARRAAKALVDRVGLAVVGLRNVGEGVAAVLRGRLRRREGRPFLQDGHRVVSRTTVDHDVLDLNVFLAARSAVSASLRLARRARPTRGGGRFDLRQHALERLLEKAPVVVVGGDDREFHIHKVSFLQCEQVQTTTTTLMKTKRQYSGD